MIYAIYLHSSVLQACLGLCVSSVIQSIDILDCLILVESGATESRRVARAEFKLHEKFSTGSTSSCCEWSQYHGAVH